MGRGEGRIKKRQKPRHKYMLHENAPNFHENRKLQNSDGNACKCKCLYYGHKWPVPGVAVIEAFCCIRWRVNEQ